MNQKIDYSKFPESDVLVNHVYERYKKGLYSLLLVTGLPGTGKSSTSLRFGELISEKIHQRNMIDENSVVDSFFELIKKVREVKRPGEVIIIEEISVLFPSRRAMTKDNVAIGRLLDTCRKRQVILIANAPIFPSIDSHIRAMGNVLIETLKINKTQEVVVSKAWRLQTNPHSGKTYRHRFTRDGKDVAMFLTRKSNKEVWENYEKKKDVFLDKLYIQLEKETELKDKKMNKQLGIVAKRTMVRALTDKELEVYHLINDKGMTQVAVAKALGKSESLISKRLQNIEKKTNITSKIANNQYKDKVRNSST